MSGWLQRNYHDTKTLRYTTRNRYTLRGFFLATQDTEDTARKRFCLCAVSSVFAVALSNTYPRSISPTEKREAFQELNMSTTARINAAACP